MNSGSKMNSASQFGLLSRASSARGLSYESFLRVKRGIGNEALIAAGLPPADQLSFDAYVTALQRNNHAAMPSQPTARGGKGRGPMQAVWAGLVIVPVAAVGGLLVSDILAGMPEAAIGTGSAMAEAAPPAGDSTQSWRAGDGTQSWPTGDSTQSWLTGRQEATPPAFMARPSVQILADEPIVPKLKPNTPTAAPLRSDPAAVAELAATAPARTVAVRPERPVRRTAPRPQAEFWQPLLDLLKGDGSRPPRQRFNPDDRSK